MKRKGVFVLTHQAEPSLRTSRRTVVWYTLGILMTTATRYNPTSHLSIPTTACSAVVTESQCGRVWQFLGAYNHVDSLSGWFLDLPYRVVAIRQVLNTGDAHRAHQHVCPAGRGIAGSGDALLHRCRRRADQIQFQNCLPITGGQIFQAQGE